MLLVTTAFSEFWDSQKETLLFLGPWCARYDQRDQWQHRQYTILKNPWDDRDRLYKDAVYCERVFDEVSEELARCLNAIHGTHYQARYWRLLVGPWLRYYIHSMYARYVLLKSALEEYPSMTTRILPEEDFIVPCDMGHFMTLIQGNQYNLQLCSVICRSLGIPCSVQNSPAGTLDCTLGNSASKAGRPAGSWQGIIKQLAKGWLYSVMNALCALRRKPIVIADPDFSLSQRVIWNLSTRARRKTGVLRSWFKPEERFDAIFDKRREGLKALRAGDSFTAVLVSTLPLSFPTLYLEGYHRARERAQDGWNYTPRVCAASTAWYYNERFKFLAAEWSEKNCRLAAVQHGGGYGAGKHFVTEWHERKICDRFFAWGWSYQDPGGRVKDLPAPLLARANRFPRRSPRSFSQLLLVVTKLYLYPYRLDSLPQASQIKEYIQWRIRFINVLRGESRENLLLRQVPTEYGWCEVDCVRDACGHIRYDDMSVSLLKRLRRVRLAVFDHQTTAYLEALAFNVPCILFWRPDHWEVRETAAPFFDALSECGILHDDPEKAGIKALEVYENPRPWWESEKVQTARQRFVERFALGRKDWVNCWVKALEQEMVISQVKER